MEAPVLAEPEPQALPAGVAALVEAVGQGEEAARLLEAAQGVALPELPQAAAVRAAMRAALAAAAMAAG
jgi:hypothetical protein